MLQYSAAIIAYSQQVLDMQDLFGTLTNTIGTYNFIEKGATNRSWIRAKERELLC